MTGRRALAPAAAWAWLGVTLVVRSYACWATPVPGRDGVAYLWMADRWRDGDPAALFATVFHPLYPALITLVEVLLPGLDSVHAGQIASAAPAALASLPLWILASRLFGARAANWACLGYAVGVWYARHPAHCMSEGPFYLAVTGWALLLAGPSRRPVLAGLAAGLAYLLRPEGAALFATGLLFLLGDGDRRGALRFGVPALALLLLEPFGSLAFGQGFCLTPKAAFNWEVGAGGAGSVLGHYAAQWLRWPGDAIEGLGYLIAPLCFLGAVLHRPRRLADPRILLVLPFLAQCLIAPLLRSHHRFVSGFGVLLLPFGGALLAALAARLRARHAVAPLALLLLLLATESRLYLHRQADRTIERDLGRLLEREHPGDGAIASDMPRLLYFAGLRPPPPRRITPGDLLRQAARAECRLVLLKRGRTPLDPEALTRLGYARTPLPAPLDDDPRGEAIEGFAR